jgi:hypothetical protein
MSAKGLMSEVEVMRLRRQANDLQQAAQERVSRFRQDASAELVRLRNELALLDEQQVVRDDALRAHDADLAGARHRQGHAQQHRGRRAQRRARR